MSPIKRKPVAVEATGFQNIDKLPGKIDTSENNPTLINLQAARLRQRFTLSWPLARLTAELHFGGTV